MMLAVSLSVGGQGEFCPPPISLGATNITDDSAVLSWDDSGAGNSWLITFDNESDISSEINTTLANSVNDWSTTQGQSGWEYGRYAPYNSVGFTQLSETIWGGWNNPGVGSTLNLPQLDQYGGHPQFNAANCGACNSEWAVRRWTSSYTGNITISGELFDRDGACGDGAHVRILINGMQVWEYQYIPSITQTYSLNLSVNAGDQIDFAIDPSAGDAACDDTQFTANIAAESPYIISGLAPSTSYQFYVAAICENGDVSLWSDPSSFTTEGLPSSGCTDPTACNYSEEAFEEGGSCIYPEEGYTCDGTCINDSNGDGICDSFCQEDLNSDGYITIQDLLLILSEFGCTSSCVNDINQDGYVTVEDLLLVQSEFGNICD